MANCNGSAQLTSKWGCDGASGQSEYKQQPAELGNFSDKHLFMMSMVPIEMRNYTLASTSSAASSSSGGCSSLTLWKNPRPSSTKYCRPIMFEYSQETKEKTTTEVANIEAQIQRLQPTTVTAYGKSISVFHRLVMTMIDGKVCQALTDTPSASTCVVCHATPKMMNNLDAVRNRQEREDVFRFGLSTLHAWIRFMDCILHIAYNLPSVKWSATTKEQKDLKAATKARIQEEFRQETGLIIDVPRQGSGNSNDGNTARRFFANPEVTSSITGVNLGLISRFSVILQTIVSGGSVDKFEVCAFDTANLFVNKYEWYYMPAYVHKILIHGASIIRAVPLPIGELSEEAQEARNKDYKNFRLHHTRKITRTKTNNDLFRLLFISSDPFLATLRYLPKKNDTELCQAVKDLLKD